MLALLNRIFNYYRVKADPVSYARSLGVSVGDNCRFISIRPGTGTFGSEPYLISIGDHVTITGGVQFVNHDGGVWVFREKEPDIDVFGEIVIGDNVFIGYGAILMPGINVGDNCVIGAGSIVTKDVPSGSVSAGVPAKVIQSVDNYRQSIDAKVDHVRALDHQTKREFLINKFMK